MTEILDAVPAILHKPLFIIAGIFIAVFCLMVIARLVFAFLLNQAYKHYKAIKETGQKIFDKKSFAKKDEELLRKKALPRAHSELKAERLAKANQGQESGSYELIPSQEQQLAREEMNDVKIVDIVKPIGFWTSMILGQKLTYLIQSAQTINKRAKQGFWVSMIEAKEREAGRQHSRGR